MLSVHLSVTSLLYLFEVTIVTFEVTIVTLVNQKALVVAATLFNTLVWAKNGGKGKQKIYVFLL